MKMDNTTYDELVLLSEIVIPCIAAIICLFGDTFGIPFATQIGGFLAGVGTIIGVNLRESRKLYTPKAYDEESDEEVREDIEARVDE